MELFQSSLHLPTSVLDHKISSQLNRNSNKKAYICERKFKIFLESIKNLGSENSGENVLLESCEQKIIYGGCQGLRKEHSAEAEVKFVLIS